MELERAGFNRRISVGSSPWIRHTISRFSACLPPYSPELDPDENVWEYLRKNNLALRIHDTYDAIVDACCNAWTDLLETPQKIASITTRRWAKLS
jgi:hypothetical protein